MDDFEDLWMTLLHGVKSFEDFPMWIQLLPRVLFQMIDENGELFEKKN